MDGGRTFGDIFAACVANSVPLTMMYRKKWCDVHGVTIEAWSDGHVEAALTPLIYCQVEDAEMRQ